VSFKYFFKALIFINNARFEIIYCTVNAFGARGCFGFNWANKKLKEARESHAGCVYWECARNRNIDNCFLCKEFPCKATYDSKEAVYTKQALDMWKEMGKTGWPY